MNLKRFVTVLFAAAIYVLTTCPSFGQSGSLDEAKALNQDVIRLYNQGRYAEAIPYAEKALAISEKVLGPEHPDTASFLNNLAGLYLTMGAYDKAEPLYRRSLEIREKVQGPEHPKTAESISNLAGIYEGMGSYDKAELFYQRSLAISEKVQGPEHADTADSLNSLAMVYKRMAAYDKAEPLYLRSLAIWEKIKGLENPNTASSLNNLAELYRAMGAYDKAEPLYRRSLAILEKVQGPEHPNTAYPLNNLALLYLDTGAYDKAEPLYRRSLEIREKALGPEHPNTGTALNNLAGLYLTMGAYDKAEPLYRRSLEIREKALGPEHPKTAQSMNNLAELYRAIGAYDRAEPLYKRSLAINEKVLGPEHPDTATSLNNLAVLYASLGQDLEALAFIDRAQEIDRKQIEQILGFAAEAQQTKFLATREGNLYVYLSLIRQRFPDNPGAKRAALDVWLSRKGILMEAQKGIQDALVNKDNPQAREVYTNLTHVREELARLVLGGPGKEGSKAYQERIAELAGKKETLEGQLSRLSKSFAQRRKTTSATTADVAVVLPSGSILVDFARIRDYSFKGRKWGSFRYLAFVLRPGKADEVSLIDLGEADGIDRKVAALKKALKDLDTFHETLTRLSTELNQAVFAPLKPAIGGTKRIFLSPDGSLNLIPFEVLRGPEGRYLIEDYTFTYLAAGRDLAGFGMVKDKGGKALLFGDPDFDLDIPDMVLAKRAEEGAPTALRSRDMKSFRFERLPDSKEEVEAIAKLMERERCELYTGKEAKEEVLMAKESPRILHLATHGFFLDDQGLPQAEEGFQGISRVESVGSKKVPNRIENPLLRSGIVLAGANRAMASEGFTNGIVTAEKILGLKLRGTDLVVLSACETGMGEVKNGEGVYGLRRAFSQAGAKSIVMSLWNVPDRETKELMVSFYRNILSGKMRRDEALRQAALQQMETVRKRYGQPNPFYWGAFVFLGEAE